MQPILFTLGPLTVYSYGVFVVLGFAAAAMTAWVLAGQAKLPRQRIVDCVLATAFGGLLGARVWYLLLRPEEAGSFWNWFAVGGGRLALAGGIVGGLAGLLYVLRRHQGSGHLSVWQWLDIAAIAAMVGLAVGRVGSFLNGDFLGGATSLPWGATYDDRLALAAAGEQAHPLAVYATILYAAIAAYGYRLWKLGAGKAKPGLVFWSTAFLLGVVQVVLEAWHVPEDALRVGGVRAAVLTGLVLIAVSTYTLVRRYQVGLSK
ncbi:MAG TPA: prolipoprotein diacylglyceryl transferase family protein [Patescibacteria group bacterium]|jgi:phosphatidylglycerol:prolipoprotein diacylglycerol transferase